MALALVIENPTARVRLARLLAKGNGPLKRNDEGISWEAGATVPRWLSRRRYVASISQIYQGELATAQFCESLLDKSDDALFQNCIRLQMSDERRHAKAYRRYLTMLGGISEMDPVLGEAYARARNTEWGPEVQMLAYHIVLESEALELQKTMRSLFPCQVLAQINSQVSRDEARHVAFGKIFLKGRFGGMVLKHRIEIYFWLKQLWHSCARAALRGVGGRPLSWMAGAVGEFDRCWALRARDLLDVGLLTLPELSPIDCKTTTYLCHDFNHYSGAQ